MITLYQSSGLDSGDNASRDRQGRKFTESYFALITLPTETAADVEATVAASYAIGQEHPTRPGYRLVDIEVRHGGGVDNTRYEVTLQYRTATGTFTTQDVPDLPTDRPAHVSWGTWAEEQIREFDRSGNAIENAAGDKFDPPIRLPIGGLLLTVTRYVDEFNAKRAARYLYTVNSKSCRLAGQKFSARECRLVSWTADLEVIDGEPYWLERIEIQVATTRDLPDGEVNTWDYYPINAGYNRLNIGGDQSTKTPIEIRGEVPSVPQNLAANGTLLADDADRVFLQFRVYPERDFNAIGLKSAGDN